MADFEARRPPNMCRLLILLAAALLGGCPTPMPYESNPRMLDRHSVVQARALLVRILEKAVHVSDVQVLQDRVLYHWAGGERAILLREVDRVDIYPNNRAFIYARDGRELLVLILPQRLDCTRVVDLLMALRDVGP